MIHSLRAFRHRNYRLFFCGQSLAVLGNWIQYLAMTWLVYRLTGSAWLLGVTGFASQIAILLFAPFGGLWADRVDRRRLLLWTQAAAMVPVREDLASAIAFNALMQNGGRMLGPTIAGVLIAASGEAVYFLINGVSKIAALAAGGVACMLVAI